MDATILETLILKASLENRQFLSLLIQPFKPEYFEDPVKARIFRFLSSHYTQYAEIPPTVLIEANCGDIESTKEVIEEIRSLDYDVVRHYDALFNDTNTYLKEQALKKAILESVDVVKSRNNFTTIRSLIDEALSKDLKIDVGTDYFNTISDRLRRMFNPNVIRVPSFYPTLDELISGGFPPYTLSIFAGGVHTGKSMLMANLAKRQVLAGYNVALASMEMSEDMFAQRFDALFTNKDINRIYQVQELKTTLMRTLKTIKEQENLGTLYIKQFPTGASSVMDIRAWLRELQIRGTRFSIIYVDYINLMKPMFQNKGDLYSDVKRVSEELRALSFEFQIPVVSVTQLNREGMRMGVHEIDMTYIGESIGVSATCDFLGILADDEDSRVYENELSYIISKNRLGGQVGFVTKMYQDIRSLRVYDSSELDMWLQDASVSGDERNIAEQPEPERRGRRR